MELIAVFLVLLVGILWWFGVWRVNQSEQRVVERLGRYSRTLQPGLHIIIPFIDRISAIRSVTENLFVVEKLQPITLDNVKVDVELSILWRIVEAEKTVYRIGGVDRDRTELGRELSNSRVEKAIETTVVGVVRSVVGRTELDGIQSNRSQIVEAVENELKLVSEEWGIKITRVEITDITPDPDTQRAMQLQINAERERRALVRQAEGRKEAAQLAADADLYTAQKQAEAKKTLAEAEAYSVSVVAKSIADGGAPAVEFEVKKIQAQAVESIGTNKSSKIVLLPSDVLDSFGKLASKFLNKN
jgi:regulator of protease activity HflC (stomatin/prohibitin superfamily)